MNPRGQETPVQTPLEKDYEKLFMILGGHIFFQTLSAAVQLDLFTLLSSRPRLTRSAIASALGIQDKPARILLLGCTNLGLLRKVGSTYANSPLAEQFFVRTKPGSLVPIVEWQHFINYKALYSFAEALKTNTNVGLNEFAGEEATLYERLAHRPDLEKIFQDAMQAISAQANTLLAEFVDFSHVRHLLDVGGGNGTNIMTLAHKYPHLQATVFDAPSVCAIARERIAAAGLQERLDAHAGNCFLDAFPPEIDCILFAHFFTIWSEDKNKRLLEKCYHALPRGGSVILFNMMQSDKEDGPLSASMGSPYFLTLATGEGMLYTWREYQTWMKEVGFKTVKKQVLPNDHGVVIGTKK